MIRLPDIDKYEGNQSLKLTFVEAVFWGHTDL